MKIKAFSYIKGIKLPKIKSLKTSEEVKSLEEPSVVYVSVKQIKGLIPKPVVVKGDKVKVGTTLACVGDNYIYSPVSGTVMEVKKLPSVYGSITDAIVIENDKKGTVLPFIEVQDAYSKEELFTAIKKACIVDYDGVAVFKKLENVKTINTLVINAVTDEPYETNNIEIIKNNLKDVLYSAKLMATAYNIKKISIALTKDYYLEFKKATQLVPAEELEQLEVCLVPNFYPVGDESELYYALTKTRLVGNKPIDKGTLILDIYTLNTIFNLLTTGMCDINRLITIHDATKKQITETTVWAKVGTSIEEVVKAVREEGFVGVKKLVAGGPMRGTALGSESAPITKGLKSIILFGQNVKDVPEEVPCINCGLCDKVCPAKISPMSLDKVIINTDMVKAKEMGVQACTRCGCCSFICPAKRHLTQRMQYAKEFIKDKGI